MDFAKAKRLISGAIEEAARLRVAQVSESPSRVGEAWRPDLEITADGMVFLVEYKSRSTSESVGSALALIRSSTQQRDPGSPFPLLVVHSWATWEGGCVNRQGWIGPTCRGMPPSTVREFTYRSGGCRTGTRLAVGRETSSHPRLPGSHAP